MDVTIFGIHLHLDPVAFTIPIGSGWSVYWYGIIIATGFMLALVYGYRNADRLGINVDRMLDVALVTTPLAILCARAYYLLFDKIKGNFFSDFFRLNGQGFSGLAIYGGVIGAAVFGFIMCRVRKVNVFSMFDLASIGFLIGQGIGRWGNFINQEAFGGPTGSNFWGMTSENVVLEFTQKGYNPNALAHPCFLYESIWCIVGFFVLHKLSKKRNFNGEIALMYCVWYGFGRAFNELLRTDSLMIGNIRVSAVLSAAICIGAAFLIVYIRNKQKPKQTEYVALFGEEEESQEIVVENIEEIENEQDN